MLPLRHFSDADQKAHLAMYETKIQRELESLCDNKEFQYEDTLCYLDCIRKIDVKDVLVGDVPTLQCIVEVLNGQLPDGKFYRKKKVNQSLREQHFTAINKKISEVVDYNGFMRITPKGRGDWCGRYMAGKVLRNVRYCPYCNAETIYAFEYGKKGELKSVRTAFDHYFPRGRYPLLGLALYNLIPACWRCNSSFKGDNVPSKDMAHPYVDDLDAAMRFDVIFRSSRAFVFCHAKDIEGVLFHASQKGAHPGGEAWEQMFNISAIYTDLYADDTALTINRVLCYPKRYVEELRNHLSVMGLPVGDINNVLYGATLSKSDIPFTRLGKMNKDLVSIYE